MRSTLIYTCFVLSIVMVKSFEVTEEEHARLTKGQKTVWEISQFFHRWNIGLSQSKLKFTPDGQTKQVRTILGKFSKFTAAAAGIMGTVGAVFAIVMAFAQAETESPELKLLKETYSVMNKRLDDISTSINELKNLIPLENQKALYRTHENKINFAHNELYRCMNLIMSTPCTSKQDCLRRRTHIAENCAPSFDIRENVYAVANGATQDGVFGRSLLDILKDSSKCDMLKITQIVCGICTLIFRGMVVVSFKERLTIPDYDDTADSDFLNSALERLEMKRQNIEKYCLKDVDLLIMDDLQNSRSKGSSETQTKNENILTFLSSKYYWMDWFVTSFRSDSAPIMWPKQSTFGNFHVKSNRGVHTIAWPVIRGNVSRLQRKLEYLEQIYGKSNSNLDYILRNISENLYLKDRLKSLALISNSEGFVISYYDKNGTMKNKYTTGSDENPNVIRSKEFGNYLLAYFNHSLEEGECTLECNGQGDCFYYPYSNIMSCRCARGYFGDHCNETRQTEQVKRNIEQLLSTSINIPSLSTLKFQLEDSLTLLKISFANVSDAFSHIENVVNAGFQRFGELMSQQLEWQSVLLLYQESITKLQNLASGYSRNFLLSKWKTTVFNNLMRIFPEGKTSPCLSLQGIVSLLNPLKLQKWIEDINHLIVGRNDFILLQHKPLIFMIMDKMKDRMCYKDYKSAIDLALTQLNALQLQGFINWCFVSVFLGLDTTHFQKRYQQITNQQSEMLKNMTCSANIVNSRNLHSCHGGFYLHRNLDVDIICNEKFYPKVEKRMWVERVDAFSSQYSGQSSSADKVIGPPRVYNNYMISNEAWRQSASRRNEIQFLTVQFAEKVFPEELRIYEVYSAGAVKSIQAQREENKWETIWQTAEVRVVKQSRIFSPNFKPLPFLVKKMKVIIDPKKADDYVSIDAMMLIGRPKLKDEHLVWFAPDRWSNGQSQGQTYIQFGLPIDLFVHNVTVYETMKPGAIIGIEASYSHGHWITISVNDKMKNTEGSGWFSPRLKFPTQKMRSIRVNSYPRDDQVVSQINVISVIGRTKLQDTCEKLNTTSCVPCDCDDIGARSPICDVNGKCQCLNAIYHGKRCENRDCAVGQWSSWPKCPCTEHNTTVNRIRNIVHDFKGNGKECPSLSEKRSCPKCQCESGEYGKYCENRNCILSDWSPWNKVCPSHSCRYIGVQTRTRGIKVNKKGTGTCPQQTESNVCPYGPCKLVCTGRPSPIPIPGYSTMKCKFVRA